VAPDGVKDCQTCTATADQQSQVSIKLDNSPRHTAVIHGIDKFSLALQSGRLPIAGCRIQFTKVNQAVLLAIHRILVQFHASV